MELQDIRKEIYSVDRELNSSILSISSAYQESILCKESDL